MLRVSTRISPPHRDHQPHHRCQHERHQGLHARGRVQGGRDDVDEVSEDLGVLVAQPDVCRVCDDQAGEDDIAWSKGGERLSAEK